MRRKSNTVLMFVWYMIAWLLEGGREGVEIIEKQHLLINSAKLSLSSYEEYYDGVPLHPELVKQNQLDYGDL